MTIARERRQMFVLMLLLSSNKFCSYKSYIPSTTKRKKEGRKEEREGEENKEILYPGMPLLKCC
jgi:hypothetical protein